MSIKLTTVAASTIREGDGFINEEGRMVWHAISDAQVARDHRGNPVIAIDVQHHPDGGLETRHYHPEMEWGARYVRRATGPQGAA